MALNSNQKSFIDSIWPYAVQTSKRTGVNPNIIVGQAALETGWGKSAPQNNYFGIKGSGGTQKTTEFLNGKWVTVYDTFRGYSSIEDSVKGYGDFILTNPRYTDFRNSSSIADQLSALQKSGYATDPNYGSKVGGIVDKISGYTGGLGDSIISGVKGLEADIANASKSFDTISKAIASGNIGDAVKTLAGDKIGDAAKTVGSALGIGSDNSSGSDNDGIFGWVKELFSANTAARFTAVFIGIVLVGVAIFFLTGTDKLVVEGGKAVAKAVI